LAQAIALYSSGSFIIDNVRSPGGISPTGYPFIVMKID